jgi:hypothetical protein
MIDMLQLFAVSVSLNDFPWFVAGGTAVALILLIFFLFFYRALKNAEDSPVALAVAVSVGVPVLLLMGSFLTWFAFARWFPAFSFRGDFPWWVAIPLASILTVLVFFMYFRESMKLDVTRRILLAGLRSLTIFSILVLLCKPVWDYPTTGEKPRPIVVLVDTTESMKQRDARNDVLNQVRVAIARGDVPADKNVRAILENDEQPSTKINQIQALYTADELAKLSSDEPTRIDIVKQVFTNPKLNLLARLGTKGPLKLSTFGVDGVPVLLPDPNKDGTWPALQPTQPQTALFGGIFQSMQIENNELPAAVVVVSDGLNNVVSYEDAEKRKPVDQGALIALCKKLQIPLHIYGVGGGSSHLLHMKELDANGTLFVEDRARVRVAWRCRGVKSGMVQVDVALNGKVVASQKYPVREGEHLEETLTFEPRKEDAELSKKEGRLNLTATVKLVDTGESDSFSKPVRVVENKVKLLFVESTPRWEFKFLQRAFLRDRRVEPWYIVLNGDKETMKSGKPYLEEFPKTREELFKFDLLFIGDVDLGFFSPDQQGWIHDFVADGGGLVMISGRQHAPSSYFGSKIGDILPVEFQKVKFPIEDTKRPVEFKPKLSDFGKRSAMMSLADTQQENERVWQSLPGWYWLYPTTRLKAAAVTLLEHPKQENEDKRPMPLMAMQYAGRGLVLFCASDETWRWRWNDENEADKFFSRFWGQVIYTVGLPRALAGRSQLGMTGEAVLGQPGKIFARLYTKDSMPLRAQQVSGFLEWNDAPDGTPEDLKRQRVTFEAVPNQVGEYFLTMPNDRAGKFTLKVADGQESREGTSLEYRVTTPPGSENAPGNLDQDTLAKLASETGGAFYREEDLYKLADAINPKSVTYSNPHNSMLFWEKWWVLVSLVGLLTAEWLVRKFSNMS